MSSQSASTRTAPQATVNAYADRLAPVELVDEVPTKGSASVCWIPAIILGTWIEFAYVVPAVSSWLAQLLN